MNQETKKTILLIEDDQRLSGLLERVLVRYGYKVLKSDQGKKGLSMAFTSHPDLILLDIMLPDTEGMSLLHSLRTDAWGKNVPVILLTNLSSNENVMQGLVSDNPSYYFVKADTSMVRIAEAIESIFKDKIDS